VVESGSGADEGRGDPGRVSAQEEMGGASGEEGDRGGRGGAEKDRKVDRSDAHNRGRVRERPPR